MFQYQSLKLPSFFTRGVFMGKVIKKSPSSMRQVLQRAKKLLSESDKALAHLDSIIENAKEKRLH